MLGIPWLCNASLAGLAIFLIHRITLEITAIDARRVGRGSLRVASGAFGRERDLLLFDARTLDGDCYSSGCCFKPTPTVPSAPASLVRSRWVLHNPFPHTMFRRGRGRGNRAFPKNRGEHFFPVDSGYLSY